jgi:hypothetical protein
MSWDWWKFAEALVIWFWLGAFGGFAVRVVFLLAEDWFSALKRPPESPTTPEPTSDQFPVLYNPDRDFAA